MYTRITDRRAMARHAASEGDASSCRRKPPSRPDHDRHHMGGAAERVWHRRRSDHDHARHVDSRRARRRRCRASRCTSGSRRETGAGITGGWVAAGRRDSGAGDGLRHDHRRAFQVRRDRAALAKSWWRSRRRMRRRPSGARCSAGWRRRSTINCCCRPWPCRPASIPRRSLNGARETTTTGTTSGADRRGPGGDVGGRHHARAARVDHGAEARCIGSR